MLETAALVGIVVGALAALIILTLIITRFACPAPPSRPGLLEEVTTDGEFTKISKHDGIMREQSWSRSKRDSRHSNMSGDSHRSKSISSLEEVRKQPDLEREDQIEEAIMLNQTSNGTVVQNPLFGMSQDAVLAAMQDDDEDDSDVESLNNQQLEQKESEHRIQSGIFEKLAQLSGEQVVAEGVLEKGNLYPGTSDIHRLAGYRREWNVSVPGYSPPDHTDQSVLDAVGQWADPTDPRGLRFNAVDLNITGSTIDRTSFEGFYSVGQNGRPKNPKGRTGICGRGLLGRWGPNHAVDPIVTRWAFDENGEPIYRNGKRVLEAVLITRKDNGMLALPGGFISPGEKLSRAIQREFSEEALNSFQMSAQEKKRVEQALDSVFTRSKDVFRGWVNDPRNTDNAWVETVAKHFHDEDGTALGQFSLQGGDDASSATWAVVGNQLELYADHLTWLKMVADSLDAFWLDDSTSVASIPDHIANENAGATNIVYAPPLPGGSKENVKEHEDESSSSPEKGDSSSGHAPITRHDSFCAEENEKGVPSMWTLKRRKVQEAQEQEAKEEAEKEPKKRERPIHKVSGLSEKTEYGFYSCDFLGSVGTSSHEGDAVLSGAISHVLKKEGLQYKPVELELSLEFVVIHLGDRKTHRINMADLSYAAVSPQHEDKFGFIATNKTKNQTVCHVLSLKSADAAKKLEAAFKLVFDAAKEVRGDPFAIERKTSETAFAVDGYEDIHIDRSNIFANMIIGQGQYGKVFLGTMKDTSEEVAIKLITKFTDETSSEFLAEAAIMLELEHECCLPVVGLCLEKTPWLLVVPFMAYKDLGVVLRKCRHNAAFLRSHEQLAFLSQVIDAVDYIGSKRIVHRDIAARNVMLHHNNQIKLGDFGLARHIPEDRDYWRLDKAGNLPVRYMAIESLTLKRFYVASDVWAFGVFMWEVISYGLIPWESEGVKPQQVRKEVMGGRRLVKPDFLAPSEDPAEQTERDGAVFDQIYQLAQDCWEKEIEDRPTSQDLKKTISDMWEEQKSQQAQPMRDVGEMCFKVIGQKREKDQSKGQRGGSAMDRK